MKRIGTESEIRMRLFDGGRTGLRPSIKAIHIELEGGNPLPPLRVLQEPRMKTGWCRRLPRTDYLAYAVVAAATLFTATAFAEPLTKTFSKNEVTLTLTITPAVVDLATDTEVSMVLSCPEGMTATLPADIADRFDGFTIAGSYTSETASEAIRGTSYNFRLTPLAGAREYRIKPIPISVQDTSSHPPASSWFPTETVRLEGPPAANGQTTSVSTDLKNKFIRPSFKDAPKFIGLSLLGLLLIGLLVYAISKIRLQQKIHRMTPSERALRELLLLLGRQLPEKGLFKDFYIELTMVVRRYIERRYGIRAPEQTTEEFLAAALAHGGFNTASMSELKEFLTAADLVKFAGVAATVSSAEVATAKAKAYIEQAASLPTPDTGKEAV